MLNVTNSAVEDLVRDAIYQKIRSINRDIRWCQHMHNKYHSDGFYASQLCALESDRQKLYFVLSGHGRAPYVSKYSGRFIRS